MRTFLLCIVMLVLLSGCAKKSESMDVEAYKKEITAWQQKRAASISNETGWITLAGLFWLKPGENKFGSDSTNAIPLPKSAPAVAGSLWLKDGGVTLTAMKDAGVKVGDSSLTKAVLKSDADTSGPTVVHIGPVLFFVVKRANLIGVRVKDAQSPARLHFAGLQFFPINPEWRAKGKFTPYSPAKQMPIATVISTTDTFACPGEVSFTLNGLPCKLIAMLEPGSDGELYYMFSDETRGKETYGAGRQLYSPMPDSAGNVVLDFNKSINWPCAYTPYATCPIPPKENHLPLRIEAGEKNYTGQTGE